MPGSMIIQLDRTKRMASLLAALALLFAMGQPLLAQKADPQPRLRSLTPDGARSYLSQRPGTLRFGVSNPLPNDLDARVVTFYEDAPDTQYGRDVWLPSKATLWSWFPLGPPPKKTDRGSVELRSYLYDRTGKTERLIRSSEGQPYKSDLLPFEKRDAITTVMLDLDIQDGSGPASTPEQQARADELHEFVRVFRHGIGLSSRLNAINQRFLPPISEAFDGIDQFVLASDRIVNDGDGRRALRGWLERGGHLWIPLDYVSQETVSALLGDVLNLQVVDRVSLTNVLLKTGSRQSYYAETEPRDFEKPVDLVRVLAPGQQIFYTVDGWPAATGADIGRGRVVFTMLGTRGWTRPRTEHETPSKYKEFPLLPVASRAFQYVIDELQVRTERPLLPEETQRNFVSDQISYKVVNRSWVLLVFSLLFVGLVAGWVALARRSLLEHLGWIGPFLAICAAAIFVGLGARARSAVPPTAAVVQFVDAVPGSDVIPVSGYLGVYQPDVSQIAPGAQQGVDFNLDFTGLTGRVHSRLQEDLNRWHWENIELPPGSVRTGTFQYAIPGSQPIEAVLEFGSEGVEGKFTSGPFHNLEDALLIAPGPRALPATLGPDGSLKAGGADGLQDGQLISAGLLTDRQRSHQDLYEKLLAEPLPHFLANRLLLLAWADPVDMHFVFGQQTRLAGAALLMIPFRFEKTPPGKQITVPNAFVDCRRLGGEGQLLPPANEFRFGVKNQLRFQLPPEVLRMKVEKARLSIKIRAPLRTVDVGVVVSGEEKHLKQLASPFGLEQIEITDPALLPFDKDGRLTVTVDVSNVQGKAVQDVWYIDWVGMEVRGRTGEANTSPPVK